MKKILLLGLTILTLSLSAAADELKGGRVACLSEELYDQAITAAVRKDQRAWQYLMKHGCFIPKAGVEISVLDFNIFSASKVRVYLGETAIEMWTSSENIKRD